MLQRLTILEQCELHRSGTVLVKLALLVVDGSKVISQDWHRAAIPQEVDPQLQMAAVNAHLEHMGAPQLSQSEVDFIAECHAFLGKPRL